MSSGKPDKFDETPLSGGRGITCGLNRTPLPFTLRTGQVGDDEAGFVGSVKSHSECGNVSSPQHRLTDRLYPAQSISTSVPNPIPDDETC